MLYLSLIIILLGVVVLLYSISVEVKNRAGGSERDVKGGETAPAVSRPETAGERPAVKTGDAEPGREGARAVLYEDASGLIDYQLSTGTVDIDPEMSAYRKISRIGGGDLVYEKHGISFYMQNRLYRFDFHRFEDLAMGDNYIAVRLKGSQSTKLFILENNRHILAAIGGNYRSYLK